MKPKRLLGVASADDLPEFQISEDAWHQIEGAYGQKILPSLRQQIEDHTLHFLKWATYERTAPPAKEAEKLAHALGSSGAKVAKALRDLLASGDAPRYVRVLIERQLPKGDPSALRVICKLIESMNLACRDAKRVLGEEVGFQPGKAWKCWVRDMHKSLEQHGHKPGCRNDDLGRGPAPSRTVVLIRELQKLIPIEYCRHSHSDGSLAANILKATRSIRLQRQEIAAAGNRISQRPRCIKRGSGPQTRRAGKITARPAI